MHNANTKKNVYYSNEPNIFRFFAIFFLKQKIKWKFKKKNKQKKHNTPQ